MSIKTTHEDVILEVWLETYRTNSNIQRIVRGVAGMLELDVDTLLRYVPRALSVTLLRDAGHRMDLQLALESAIEYIAKTLVDHEMWDAYHESRAPSAYRYVVAVVAWMYLYAEHLGVAIPRHCVLFSDSVASAIAEFLATKVAQPISETIRESINKWLWSLPPKQREELLQLSREQREEVALIRTCAPSK